MIMSKMISILDTKARDEQKENFNHGFLLELLRSEPNWLILSNAESGEGFSDILIEPEDPNTVIVIEVKYTAGIAGLDEGCRKAMEQIKAHRYDENGAMTAEKISLPMALRYVKNAVKRFVNVCRNQPASSVHYSAGAVCEGTAYLKEMGRRRLWSHAFTNNIKHLDNHT